MLHCLSYYQQQGSGGVWCGGVVVASRGMVVVVVWCGVVGVVVWWCGMVDNPTVLINQ